MAIMDLSIDAERAVERLMRFLAVEGVTGHEQAIGAEVEKTLRKAGVPASAIRYDSANEHIPVPTETGNLYSGADSTTASVVADFSSGSPRTYRPVSVNGRSYVAIVAPPDTAVTVVSLFDSAGHKFASAVTTVGGSTGTLPMGK